MKHTELLISKNETLTEALKKIDKSGKKIVFALDGTRLCGALSDGDIRRFLLKGGKLDDLVDSAVNITPKFLFDTQRSGAIDYMVSNRIDAVPVVDDNLNVLDDSKATKCCSGRTKRQYDVCALC